MRIFFSLNDIPRDFGPTVVGIGNFDGVHCGHQWLLAELLQSARQRNARSVAVTFDPHPTRLLRPAEAPRLITPMPERLRLIQASGIDATLVLPFTDTLSQMSGQDFVQAILVDALHAAEVHEGDNFRFGHRAQSGSEDLIRIGAELGFAVHIFPPRIVRGDAVSSSRIRDTILAGDMSTTRALLGRPFSIHSTPAPGRGIGHRLTVPTINLAPYTELVPANGVYVTQMTIAGTPYESITNAGNRPTFGEDSYAIETHLLDYQPETSPIDLTPATPIELTFLKHLRPEKKFSSPQVLKAQIMQDISRAKRYMRLRRALRRQEKATQPAG